MPRRIFKYPFSLNSKQTLEMPACPEFLHVGLDPQGRPCLWAGVEDSPDRPITLFVRGTGHLVPPHSKHLGSFLDGAYVWHVFVELYGINPAASASAEHSDLAPLRAP